MATVLLTGGAGYIGTHTCVEIIAAGGTPIILDNLANSSRAVLERIERITGTRPSFIEGDLRDIDVVDETFSRWSIDAVIHLAGLKAVGESVGQPLHYYQNNISGTLTLLDRMQAHRVRRLIFSSSATVYATTATMPLTEDSPLHPSSPYGRTKLMIEQIVTDLVAADPSWCATLLRYFNPVGAHSSGLIGEDPNGVPNNLMPFVCQVAVGRLAKLSVFGGDYPTPDGTGVRDYIHVVDLARGHVRALDLICNDRASGISTLNLGTGRGYSVLDVVREFERVSGCVVPYQVVDRRPGDVATCYADASRARAKIGWNAEYGLAEMCADAWRWQATNPNGYAQPSGV